ncbi:MAG: sugar nucleotide-binding protein [Gemmataceae bacterium]|nr:sugar nucleotide-binding protein [Gemmataceae bacterium]MDW8265274.1 sugar nucleotide-binding protein [Gemmataceae bacterium]
MTADDFQQCLPLLITGISGVAGYNAFHYFQRRYPGQVIGTRARQTFRLLGPGIVALDAEDLNALRGLFRRYRFRSVLNCVGNCALKSCELDPAMARKLNVASAWAIVQVAKEFRARLVHLSSDLVFSGSGHGQYVETDPVDPVTVYGKTMVEAEALVRGEAPRAAILRISLPMGPSFNRHAGAIDWIGSRFRHGRPATLYFDEVRSCTYCDDLNRVFERFLAGDESGLYHLGGPRPNTLYQIAQIVNRVGGYDPDLLRGCLRHQAGPVPPRAGNVTMNSDKLIRLLGQQPFRPWPAEPELWPPDRQWHYRRPAEEHGSFQQIVERLYRCPLRAESRTAGLSTATIAQ